MTEKIQVRRVQAYSSDRSLTIVLPKTFSEKLNIGKGDYLTVHIENEDKLVSRRSQT